ncbi:MAG: insulinase family protein [Clostridiales bacterium]|nr:insulinase family protein [Clostridiales bacterium]
MKSRGYELIKEQVYSGRLLNGMPVFVIKKRGFYKTYAFFATNYGGADRRFRYEGQWIDTPEGVAHFLEHKMFDTEDGNALERLSANGAQPNAYTSSDITAYFFESTEKFEENLRILLDFVSVPYFTKESVEKEQGIIGQEIRMVEDNPGHVLYYGLMKLLFRHNPARDSVAGTIESISEITDETLYRCHKIFYNPANMALCVAGDVDPGRVFEIAQNALQIPRGDTPKSNYGEAELREPLDIRTEKRMEVSEPLFMIGVSAPYPERGEERKRCELLGMLACELLSGRSSPLYIKLYADGLIKSDFSGAFESVAGIAYTAFAGSSSDPERVFDAIKSEVRRITGGGASKELFERIKKSCFGREIRALDGFENACHAYASSFFRGFDAFEMTEEMMSVPLDEVLTFMRDNMSPENMAMSLVTPSSEADA